MDGRRYPVYDILPEGKENAITTQELCNLLHLRSSRELRKMVAAERDAGVVILSSTTGGYFKSNKRDEILEFVRTTKKKGIHTLASIQSAEKALAVLDGQISMPAGYPTEEV